MSVKSIFHLPCSHSRLFLGTVAISNSRLIYIHFLHSLELRLNISKAKVVFQLLLGATIVTKSPDIKPSNGANLSDGYRNPFFSSVPLIMLPCSISSSVISAGALFSFFSGSINGNSSLIRRYISFRSTPPYRAIRFVQLGQPFFVLHIFHSLSNQHHVLFQLQKICSVQLELCLNVIMSHHTTSANFF